MKSSIAFSVVCAAAAAVAAPVVSDVTMTQSDDTVTIGYTLSEEPAIITVDILQSSPETGWASIGAEHLTYMAGDVNRRVDVGAHTLTWKPRKAWPNNAVTENVKAVVSAWSVSAPPDYVVMSLVAANDVRYYADKDSIPYGLTNDLYKTEYLVMRKIPAANVEWRMGAAGGYHLVTLPKDYYIGIYEVTRRQLELIGVPANYSPMFTDMSCYATRPADKIRYEEIRGATATCNWPSDGHVVSASSFLGKLRALTGLDGIDLPTEAQWEFAYRAGSGSLFYTYPDGSAIPNEKIGRCKENGGRVTTDGGKSYSDPEPGCGLENGTAAVGSYEPNAWGVYDMVGNLREWCLDWFVSDISGSDWDPTTGPASGTNTKRAYRGGSYVNGYVSSYATERNEHGPASSANYIGFRVALELP